MHKAWRVKGLSAVVAGLCAGALGSAAAAAAPVTISFMSSSAADSTSINTASDKKLIAAFEATHPNIKVTLVANNESQIPVLIAAGSAPDIVSSCCSFFHELGVDGSFIDLSPFIGAVLPDYQATQAFWSPQFDSFQSKGKQFALPLYLGTIANYFNQDLFDNAGIAPPADDLKVNQQTWADFEAMCKKLVVTSADGRITQYALSKGLSGDRIGYWLQAAGAQFYKDDDHGVSGLASPEAVDALGYLQRLRYEDNCLPPAGTSVDFRSGKLAMWEDGSWSMQDLILNPPGFKWNIAPLPIGPAGQRATLATIDGYAISKSTKHLNEALQFLDFLVSVQGNEMRSENAGLQPSRREVAASSFYINRIKSLNPKAADINIHVFTDAGPYAYPQYLYTDQKIADGILNNAYTRIFEQRAPVKDTWYEAVERLNTTLAAEAKNGNQAATHPAKPLSWAKADWSSQDVNMLIDGGAQLKGAQLELDAGGADIWGAEDAFHYVYQSVSGDFTATVKLLQSPTTDGWSKAGIMVRQSTAPGSSQAIICGTGENGINLQWRPQTNASSDGQGGPAWSNGSPVWLKLVRQGGTVTGYSSPDGAAWTKVGSATIDLKDPVLIGPAATSHAYGVIGAALFSDWSLTQG